jgi:hypothetical protein
VKQVQPSHRDSYERLCHDARMPRFMLAFPRDEALRHRLIQPRPERFIGVIYRPETELLSHNSEASLAQQFPPPMEYHHRCIWIPANFCSYYSIWATPTYGSMLPRP